MKVWNGQDWAWRAAALLGFVVALALASYGGCMLKSLFLVALLSGPVIVCWLALIRWPLLGVIWALLWGVPALAMFVSVLTDPDCGLLGVALLTPPLIHLFPWQTRLLFLAVPPAAILSSQIWIVFEANTAVTQPSKRADHSMSDSRLSLWRRAGWTWLLFAGLGAMAAISAVIGSGCACALWH